MEATLTSKGQVTIPKAVRDADQASAAGGHELIAASGITRKK